MSSLLRHKPAPALPAVDDLLDPALAAALQHRIDRKTVRRTQARFGDVAGAWSALSGLAAVGYEIHAGQTAQHPAMAAQGDVARDVVPGLAWQNTGGNVLGVYLHGLFEDAAVLHALFGARAPSLDAVFDGLAAQIEQAFAPGALASLIG